MKDNVVKKGKWTFDEEVTACFENMISRSIPDYTTMRYLVSSISDKFIDKRYNFRLLDIGCSNGINLKAFIENYGSKGKYVGIDNSQSMIDTCTENFKPYEDEHIDITLYCQDIRNFKFNIAYTIITDILTIQFVPVEYRQDIYKSVYENLENDGVFISVNKVLENNDVVTNLYIDEYYKIKSNNGYTQEQILSKKKALEGVLVPLESDWNKDMLRSAGFRYVSTFWKCLNFEGYIALK